jgi:hypothetical protein
MILLMLVPADEGAEGSKRKERFRVDKAFEVEVAFPHGQPVWCVNGGRLVASGKRAEALSVI